MKEEVFSKVEAAMEEEGLEALIVFGYDNIQYLTGAPLHYPPSYPDRYMALFWPRGETPTCILPHEWERSFLNLSWTNKTRAYTERPGSAGTIVDAILLLVRETVRKTGTIGIDASRTPASLYDRLESALGEYQLKPWDMGLRRLRIVKTPGEARLLEEVAAKTDHALAAQAHHVLVLQAPGEMSLTENVRVHALERGLDEVGHHAIAQVVSGENAGKWWPGAPMFGVGYSRVPKHHEWVRMELVATLNGYWCNGARMLAMGEMTEEQKADYQKLVTLREVARRTIKPGAKASEVYAAVKEVAMEKGIKLEPHLALGAGVGVSNYEPPYLSAADDTTLEPGMVIAFNPVVHGSKGELLMNRDTFLVTEEGCRILGWWKDWREPFIANYTL